MRGAALFLAVGLLYVTIKRIPLTTGLTLWFIEPFVLTVMCWIILKEKIHKVQWAAILLGFIGMVIAIKPTVAPFDIAYITDLLSGLLLRRLPLPNPPHRQRYPLHRLGISHRLNRRGMQHIFRHPGLASTPSHRMGPINILRRRRHRAYLHH